MKIEKGQLHRVKFPFVRDEYDKPDGDGENFAIVTLKTWKPGVRFEPVYPDDTREVADAEGEMLLEVIDVHKPGKYPERVFYLRRWKDPDGKEFGKGALRMTTTTRFKSLASSYKHEYELVSQP